MKNKLIKDLVVTKDAQRALARLSHRDRQEVLFALSRELEKQKETILRENEKDISTARSSGKNEVFIDRLIMTDASFRLMCAQVRMIAETKDVLGNVIEEKIVEGNVKLKKVSVPLGVLAVIYESRPNVTIDVAALCIMSGNACVLKGGSDALRTNVALVECVHRVLKRCAVKTEAVLFLETTDRNIVDVLVQQAGFIDVVIPRGGYELVKKVVETSRIPILYHAQGGARIYIDEFADLDQAIAICVNAKTQRPAACNSLDCVVVHQRIASVFLPKLAAALAAARVEIRGDSATRGIIKAKRMIDKAYATEFLDRIVAIKVVSDVKAACVFVNRYSKKHSEGIVSENEKVINAFVSSVDAAGIFINCSTRFHDGGMFGLGAEVGISTGKLHARGPVGLKEITTYKWVARGGGTVRK